MIVFLTSNVFAGNVKELQNLSLQVHMVVRLHACQCGLLLSSFTVCAGKTKSCYCCLCIIVIQLQGSSGALLQRTALILQSTNPAASHSAIHSQTQSC